MNDDNEYENPFENDELTKAIEKFIESSRWINQIALNKTVRQLSEAFSRLPRLNAETLEPIARLQISLAAIPKIELPTIPDFSLLSEAISKLDLHNNFTYLENMRNSFSNLSTLMETWNKSVFAGLFEQWEDLFKFSDWKLSEELYLNTMYEAQWFPYFTGHVKHTELYGIFEIIERTRPSSKSRKCQIDRHIFNYFTKTKLREIKRAWRATNLTSAKKKLLCQAIDSYIDKKYGLTVSAIVPLWERIIAQMANSPCSFKSEEIKKCFHKLLENNAIPTIINDFYINFLASTCYSSSEVSTEYPIRSAVAHGWIGFDKYPTRKMALNAILFTDFLFNLDAVMDITDEH